MARILIADDEDDIRLIVKILLTRAGFEVVEARDGRQALEFATADPPDLALFDIRMPYMTGLEALEQLKANPSTAGFPVLIVSAYVQESEIQRGKALGAVGYITKPFQPSDLLGRVNEVLAAAR